MSFDVDIDTPFSFRFCRRHTPSPRLLPLFTPQISRLMLMLMPSDAAAAMPPMLRVDAAAKFRCAGATLFRQPADAMPSPQLAAVSVASTFIFQMPRLRAMLSTDAVTPFDADATHAACHFSATLDIDAAGCCYAICCFDDDAATAAAARCLCSLTFCAAERQRATDGAILMLADCYHTEDGIHNQYMI